MPGMPGASKCGGGIIIVTWSTGDSELEAVPEAVPESKRDDDLESSLVLAVAVVMVMEGAELVGESDVAAVEMPGTGLRCRSDGDCESIRAVSLGKKDVRSPRRGLGLFAAAAADPIPITSPSPPCCVSAFLVLLSFAMVEGRTPQPGRAGLVFVVGYFWWVFFLSWGILFLVLVVVCLFEEQEPSRVCSPQPGPHLFPMLCFLFLLFPGNAYPPSFWQWSSGRRV